MEVTHPPLDHAIGELANRKHQYNYLNNFMFCRLPTATSSLSLQSEGSSPGAPPTPPKTPHQTTNGAPPSLG